MADVAVRDLRNHTRQILDRVDAGERVIITVDGRPMAELRAVPRRPRHIDRERFAALLSSHAADPGLAQELRELVPDSTDDAAW